MVLLNKAILTLRVTCRSALCSDLDRHLPPKHNRFFTLYSSVSIPDEVINHQKDCHHTQEAVQIDRDDAIDEGRLSLHQVGEKLSVEPCLITLSETRGVFSTE